MTAIAPQIPSARRARIAATIEPELTAVRAELAEAEERVLRLRAEESYLVASLRGLGVQSQLLPPEALAP